MSADTPKPRRRHKTTSPELSAREIRFCVGYADHGDASRAYRDAGYPSRPAPSTWVLACRVLRKVKVRQKIQDMRDAAAVAEQVTVNALAAGFRGAIETDVTDILDDDGAVLPPCEWPDSVRKHIVRLEVEELTEMQTDPDNPRRKKKVAVGTKWKVWLENKTECRKVLAQWKRMLADDRQIQEMLTEIAELRAKVATLNGSTTEPGAEGA